MPWALLPLALLACGGASPPLDAPVEGASTSAPAPPEGACARRGSHALARGLGARQSSAIALGRLDDRVIAYLADADERAIHAVDVEARRWLGVTPLAEAPEQLLVLDDGRIAATLRWDNRVVMLEPGASSDAPFTELCAAEVASEPIGMALAEDGSLWVASGWGRRLTRLASTDLALTGATELGPEPRAVLVDEARGRVIVSHAVGGAVSSLPLAGGAAKSIAIFPTESEQNESTVPQSAQAQRAQPRRDASQGYALALVRAAGRERVALPLVSVMASDDDRIFPAGYGMSELAAAVPFVALLEDASLAARPSAAFRGRIPPRDRCLVPRAIAVRDHRLLVACAGSAQLLELDARARDPMQALLRRLPVPSGPHAIALHPERELAVVLSVFAREVAFVDLGSGETQAVALAGRPESGVRARGRELFHSTSDPRISGDGRACVTCHPDGRSDGLTWSTPDGPRQVIMLAGRLADSAPFGWYGDSPSLERHLQLTFARLGGAGMRRAEDRGDVAALVAYLKSMPAPRRDAVDGELVARGAILFHDEAQGCGGCHPGGAGDARRHDVKSGDPIERSLSFDTPSLAFVAGTAPYFHDGRFATLAELFRDEKTSMGHARHLARADLAALQAYLESL